MTDGSVGSQDARIESTEHNYALHQIFPTKYTQNSVILNKADHPIPDYEGQIFPGWQAPDETSLGAQVEISSYEESVQNSGYSKSISSDSDTDRGYESVGSPCSDQH